ncbi:CoxG family protein [Sinisalibacter aestuarii]|uniref:Carbon monoxide dehydrogenase n=1 Tax=Sinisalibacter aestuarii TaxID=2949426 RepID=A0ABQ5LZN5_9RHOB|nr:SRPBCC domain-containing protein [Sinisalibacter aestuarii]GKY89632.1 hypothetical protein STA1M1_35010 [Sinisalibacter aestuarii]
MELEFSHVFDAPPAKLWPVLLDPGKVAQCVPGMQSVEVISDTEYTARIKVKIAFISAAFTLRVVIAEARAPDYMRVEVTGDDTSVASAVRAVSEVFATPEGTDRTALRVVAKATVMGRLGALGLNPMRTKAERMWEQFCRDFADVLAGRTVAAGRAPDVVAPAVQTATNAQAAPRPARRKGFLGWFAGRAGADRIRVELERQGTRVVIDCPVSQADQCFAWLDRHFAPDQGG